MAVNVSIQPSSTTTTTTTTGQFPYATPATTKRAPIQPPTDLWGEVKFHSSQSAPSSHFRFGRQRLPCKSAVFTVSLFPAKRKKLRRREWTRWIRHIDADLRLILLRHQRQRPDATTSNVVPRRFYGIAVSQERKQPEQRGQRQPTRRTTQIRTTSSPTVRRPVETPHFTNAASQQQVRQPTRVQ